MVGSLSLSQWDEQGCVGASQAWSGGNSMLGSWGVGQIRALPHSVAPVYIRGGALVQLSCWEHT